MENLKLTTTMLRAAKDLNEDGVLCVYQDCGKIRMETNKGESPYVWRGDKWVRMKNRE